MITLPLRFATAVSLVLVSPILAANERCLKALLNEGAVYGSFVSIPDTQVIENLAVPGKIHFVFLDGEHSAAIDPVATLRLATASDARKIGTVIRVPSNDFATIKRYIGTGVEGVVVPSIRTAEDAKKAVEATKYPPLGRRAAGVERSNDWFDKLSDSLRNANDRMITVVMIETVDAVANIDAIVRVPGVDVVHVGPADLALEMGHPPGAPEVRAAIAKVEAAARAAGVPLGGHAADLLTAQAMRRRGYRFFTIPGDMTLLQEGTRRFFGSQTPTPTAAPTALWRQIPRNGARKYYQKAWRESRGTFVSELDAASVAKTENVHTVALSRALYGLVQDPSYPELTDGWRPSVAARTADFLIEKLAREDETGPYFLSGVDRTNQPLEETTELKVHEQAYGLCGLVAYLAAHRAAAATQGSLPDNFVRVEDFVQKAVRAFVDRFADRRSEGSLGGGFWETFDRATGRSSLTKSFNSVVYPATAFLLDLESAFGPYAFDMASLAKAHLEATARFIDAFVLPEGARFIVEEFDAHGRPAWRQWIRDDKTMSLVGHNFQAAWFLLRMAERQPERRDRYRATAARILTAVLENGGYDREFGGVYDVVYRGTGTLAFHDRKAWWQNAEALLALELAYQTQLELPPVAWEARASVERFFLEHFVDPDGGEWDVVKRDGSPFEEAVKGNGGKSLYHTAELVRFLARYRAPRIVFEGGQP